MSKHKKATPSPWILPLQVVCGDTIGDAKMFKICHITHPDRELAETRARLIARAVNNYDAMLELLLDTFGPHQGENDCLAHRLNIPNKRVEQARVLITRIVEGD